jgi:hypothetical protein
MTTLTGNWVWGPATLPIAVYTGGIVTQALNSATIYMRMRCVVPKDGTLDKIGIYIHAITGNPPAYSLGLYDMADSLYGGSAAEAYEYTATGFVWVTLSTPATASAGDMIDVKIAAGGTPPDASNCVTVRYQTSPLTTRLPISHRYIGFLSETVGNQIGLAYSDGSIAYPGGVSMLPLSMHTGTTPDEGGALFQIPFACECAGVLLPASFFSNSDHRVRLYSAADAVLGTTPLIDASYVGTTGYYVYHFEEPVSLAADTNYRLAVLPAAAHAMSITVLTFDAVASRRWWPEGERWQLSTRTDAGAWTETDTALPMMALILSEITLPDEGSPGGGGAWSGGMLIG